MAESLELKFGYRYNTPDGFRGIVSKLTKTDVWMDLKCSYTEPSRKITPRTKKYSQFEIKQTNQLL